jgi:hypothetical protein
MKEGIFMPVHKKALRPKSPATQRARTSPLGVISSALLALPVALACGTLLLLLLTALLLRLPDPGRYATPTGIAILYFSALLAGRLTVRFSHEKLPLVCGLLSGALLTALLLSVMLILPKGGAYPRPIMLLLYAAVPLSALIGSLPRPKRKRTKRR